MDPIKGRYIVDEKGNRVGVLLDWDDYRKLLEALEELESIKAYEPPRLFRRFFSRESSHEGQSLLFLIV